MSNQEKPFIADDKTSIEYDSEKGLNKPQPKYQCIVSSEKRMKPCSGCQSPQFCISHSMQFKENENMDDKVVVNVSAEGDLLKCAKGLEAGDCGYVKGEKICGKCGAMALQQKLGEEEMMDAPSAGSMGMREESMPAEAEEEMTEEDDTKVICPKCSHKNDKGNKFCSECGTKLMDAEEKMYEGMGDEPKKPKVPGNTMYGGMTPEKGGEGMGDMTDEENSEMQRMVMQEMERRRQARMNRMNTMGVKAADWDDEAYVCGFQQKMMAGNHTPCIACPGGCAPEAGLPTLIEVQGLAEEMFAGKTLTSGYSDIKDVFIVQVKRDNVIIEAVFDGQDAHCRGWHELDEDQIDAKSADQARVIISFEEASQIAVKSIEGDVVSVDADEFEGHESYAVEINGVDGRSYDVYVSLDGQVLGYDEYDAVEAMAIDAEIAEIALKRAYSVDVREEMAKNGEAMEDGSFPIKDEADLRNAIMAHGRAKDVDAARTFIMKRAKDLGMEEMIPEEWSSGAKALTVESDPDLMAKLMEFEIMAMDEDQKLD